MSAQLNETTSLEILRIEQNGKLAPLGVLDFYVETPIAGPCVISNTDKAQDWDLMFGAIESLQIEGPARNVSADDLIQLQMLRCRKEPITLQLKASRGRSLEGPFRILAVTEQRDSLGRVFLCLETAGEITRTIQVKCR